jgi:hypothetical protein
MKRLFFIPAIVIYFLSCANNKTTQETTQNVNTDSATAVSFFPVTSFLKGQARQFDSLTATPINIVTTGEKVDSISLNKDQLKALLQPFFSPEIDETNLIKYFKETKFNDQTQNAITFSYDPITTLPDSINIITWNVYVNPTTGNVNEIYMVKHIIKNGQNITQQLTWHTDKYAEINEILNKPDGNSNLLKREKIIWNFNQ